MNDLIPIAFFVGCLLATFGLVRVCDWLKPAALAQRSEPGGGTAAGAPERGQEEGTR